MDELVKRLEAATEGSRELDAAINLEVYTQIPLPDPPPYTTSLDAALTLVPEGWEYAMNSNGAVPVADVFKEFEHDKWCGAATMPIALCIAALRAKESEK